MKKKKAKWIIRTHLFRKDEYECSACGWLTIAPYRICPNCGAVMKGSETDTTWMDEMEEYDAISGE